MNSTLPPRRPIRVLVVDDSAFMRTALSRMIASDPEFEVAATAINGRDALAKIPSLNPDVVTLDVEMPGLNGLETLREIMQKFPLPVLMVSALTDRNADTTFAALSAGAFDYVPKHLSSTSLDITHIRQDLLTKLRAAHTSRTGTIDPGLRKLPQSAPAIKDDGPQPKPFKFTPAIVAVGASTGGPKALEQILPLLPPDLPVPVLVVQHMPPGFTAPFAQRLSGLCRVQVREACHGEWIRHGAVYIAPAGRHLTVERGSDSRPIIRLDAQAEGVLHVPSIDVTMKSVADVFRCLAMGIILTGMGSDGAEGMAAIHQHGGFTVGQDQASCAVYGMPRACADARVLSRVAPLSQIPDLIIQATRLRRGA